MSIVKQIVDLAGGTIDIQSELGIGTKVMLSLPLENRLSQSDNETVAADASSENPEDPVDTVRRRARGRTVTLRGFDCVAGMTDLQSQALVSLKGSIEKYVCKWFNMSIVSSHSEKGTAADIVISDESAFLNPTSLSANGLLSQGQSLLILCSNGARRGIYASSMDTDHVIEFVSKPCGPHRLARAILNCLDKENITKAPSRTVSMRRFDASAAKQRAKLSPGGTPFATAQLGVADDVVNAGEITDPLSITEYSAPALNLTLAPGTHENAQNRLGGRSLSLSLESGMRLASRIAASSRDISASRSTTPSSLSPSVSTKDSADAPTFDLLNIESLPVVRPKMLLVEVSTP